MWTKCEVAFLVVMLVMLGISITWKIVSRDVIGVVSDVRYVEHKQLGPHASYRGWQYSVDCGDEGTFIFHGRRKVGDKLRLPREFFPMLRDNPVANGTFKAAT